jgi:hypothetical protein
MPLFRSALCFSLGTLLVVVVAAAFAGTATAQAGVQVIIQPPGKSNPNPVDIYLGETSTDYVPPDVTDKTYRVQSGRGTTKEVKVAAGVSLRALLDATGTNTGYATIEIPRGPGPPLLLTKGEVENRLAQPVFFADAQGRMRFIWPTVDGSAIPAGNYFPVSSYVVLLQRARQRLKVEISPKSKKIEPGGTITFRATTSGDRPGEKIVYYWSLAGKTPRRGGEQHVQDFPEKEDVYEVHVTAGIESAGVSDRGYAKITVGDPDGKDEEPVDPDDQPSEETLGTPSPTVSPPSPTPVPATPPPPPEPADPPDMPISGTTVEGNLLAAAGDPPPTSILESAANAARDGNPSDDSTAGADVPDAALSIAGVLALLALGAGIENRQGRRLSLRKPRIRLPRRAF